MLRWLTFVRCSIYLEPFWQTTAPQLSVDVLSHFAVQSNAALERSGSHLQTGYLLHYRGVSMATRGGVGGRLYICGTGGRALEEERRMSSRIYVIKRGLRHLLCWVASVAVMYLPLLQMAARSQFCLTRLPRASASSATASTRSSSTLQR